MAINYTPANANIRSSFASLMKSFPELRKVFFDEFAMYPTMYDKYLEVENSTKSAETENSIGGRPIWTTKTEANEFTFGDYAQGTEVAYTHITYADAFDVSEELMEDNQWKYVLRNAKEMARGGYAVVEDICADVLNDGFAAGSTGADGVVLFSSAHNLINSGSTGDNADTQALDVAALDTAYQLADQIVNEANIFVPVDFSTLVVPPELRQTAEELAKSDYDPENATNRVNVYKNRIKTIVVNPYLTSATAWFLIAPQNECKGKMFWRVKPQFVNDRDDYSGNYLCKARLRFSTGHTDWQGAIGSTGLT